jgi:hypothetical protein
MKTCSIKEMEKTVDIELLDLRRQYKTLVQFLKIKKTTKTHCRQLS